MESGNGCKPRSSFLQITSLKCPQKPSHVPTLSPSVVPVDYQHLSYSINPVEVRCVVPNPEVGLGVPTHLASSSHPWYEGARNLMHGEARNLRLSRW